MSALDVGVRVARPEEEEAAFTLVYTPPSAEAIGVIGSEGRALAFCRGLQRLGMYRAGAGDLLLVAVERGQPGDPIGMLLGNTGGGELFDWSRIPGLVGLSMRVFPLRELPPLLRRGRMRMRLNFPVPRPCFHVAEVHVHPNHRGRGIGGLLLDHAERLARERGLPRLSLTTLMTNPARRLYRRRGFEVTAERTVEGYEALTGSPGRVLMEKCLEGAANLGNEA